MAHQIIITVSPAGQAHIEVDGIAGPGCEDALALLEDMEINVIEAGHTAQWHERPERESGQRVRHEVRA